MGKILNDQQIDQYREEGFLAPIDIMSEDEAADYLARLEDAEANYPQHLNPENRNNLHLGLRLFDELVHHPIVLDVVEDLIGPNFSLWGSVLFAKGPQSAQYVSWHQDATYMGLGSHQFITPWIALTPSNRENGCMTMLPGSHRNGVMGHDETFAEDNILTRGQNIPDVDPHSGVDLVLRPGQMSVHHALTIHGSQPNPSEQRRIGYAIQSYVPSGVEQLVGENYWMPMRGECQHKNMIRLSRPQADFDEEAVTQRMRANDNWSNILYSGARKVRAY